MLGLGSNLIEYFNVADSSIAEWAGHGLRFIPVL